MWSYFQATDHKLTKRNYTPQQDIHSVPIIQMEIITNKGFLSETVSLFRALRQGCPLSLSLYVVEGEITTET